MPVSATPFSYIFASELHERLRWFGTLRWIAAAALGLVSVIGPLVGFAAVWPSLSVVAIAVGAYNLWFQRWLRRTDQHPGESYRELRRCAIQQITADLAALLVTVHFTGGWVSPVLPFVVFHMAIGTIMLATRIMYGIAAATCAAALLLFTLERTGIVPTATLDHHAAAVLGSWPVAAGLLAALVFGVVYLTDSVTSRFKHRSMQLHRTSHQLRERKEELQGLLEVKDQLERQKSHYMRISAHQLRSPLATVKTTLQVLIEGYVDPGTAEGRQLLIGAGQRVEELILIVNDLLELAKMREGRAKAPWSRNVSISQILADIFDAKDSFAEEGRVELVPTFITERAVVVDWAVPPDLVYAFENLIHNAIKYSKPAGGMVTVSQQVADGIATIVVEDDGIGIPPELQSDVFLEFVRAPNAKRRTGEGTGLGLSIVREAVQMHGGTVELSSTEGVGSKFIVRLPLHHIPPEVEELLQQRNAGGVAAAGFAGGSDGAGPRG